MGELLHIDLYINKGSRTYADLTNMKGKQVRNNGEGGTFGEI